MKIPLTEPYQGRSEGGPSALATVVSGCCGIRGPSRSSLALLAAVEVQVLLQPGAGIAFGGDPTLLHKLWHLYLLHLPDDAIKLSANTRGKKHRTATASKTVAFSFWNIANAESSFEEAEATKTHELSPLALHITSIAST